MVIEIVVSGEPNYFVTTTEHIKKIEKELGEECSAAKVSSLLEEGIMIPIEQAVQEGHRFVMAEKEDALPLTI